MKNTYRNGTLTVQWSTLTIAQPKPLQIRSAQYIKHLQTRIRVTVNPLQPQYKQPIIEIAKKKIVQQCMKKKVEKMCKSKP